MERRLLRSSNNDEMLKKGSERSQNLVLQVLCGACAYECVCVSVEQVLLKGIRGDS